MDTRERWLRDVGAVMGGIAGLGGIAASALSIWAITGGKNYLGLKPSDLFIAFAVVAVTACICVAVARGIRDTGSGPSALKRDDPAPKFFARVAVVSLILIALFAGLCAAGHMVMSIFVGEGAHAMPPAVWAQDFVLTVFPPVIIVVALVATRWMLRAWERG